MGGLFGADDPPPFAIVRPHARSRFLLVGDHAGNRIPATLGTLGLSEADRQRHIAWDLGTAALGERLAQRLDAVFVRQTYSRLVIDCNRDPHAADAIPPISDGTRIAGNEALSAQAQDARVSHIHRPYQDAIAAEIARRVRAGLPTVLVSLHSFTPVMAGIRRPWQIGILHDGANDAFALALLGWLRDRHRWVVGDNEPYVMDGTDHTVPRHAFAAGLAYAEIEIAQSELASDAGVETWSAILADALTAVA